MQLFNRNLLFNMSNIIQDKRMYRPCVLFPVDRNSIQWNFEVEVKKVVTFYQDLSNGKPKNFERMI